LKLKKIVSAGWVLGSYVAKVGPIGMGILDAVVVVE